MFQDAFRLTSLSPQITKPLHLLIVEDVPEDAELIVLTLQQAGYQFTYDIAENATSYQNYLKTQVYSAVLADYRLPGFNGIKALQYLQQSEQDIPFILVTGSLGEESAVECIKAGMTDYVIKERLFRLPTLLNRALQEFESRYTQQREMAERQRAEIALRENEQRFRALIENATDIIFILDQTTHFTYVSPSVQRILGYDPATLITQNLFDFVHPEDKTRVVDFLSTVREKQRIPQSLKEFRIRTNYNTWAMLEAIATNLQDESAVSGIVVNCHDITERHQVSEKLKYDAYYDKLTGLANRATLLKVLKKAIAKKQRRKNDLFALLFLDLDRFKVINDSLGHLIGDELLKGIAKRLQQCHREGDLLARFGGDEFVFLLKNIETQHEAVIVAQRIHQALTLPFILNHQEVFISASIGITLSSPHYEQPEQMLRDADTAMYHAKAGGKACHEVFNPSMHLSALKELPKSNVESPRD